jgi:hypothetical protein
LLDRVVLTAIALGLLVVAIQLLTAEAGPTFAGTELRLLASFGWVALFAGTVLLLRALLQVLRPRTRTGAR